MAQDSDDDDYVDYAALMRGYDKGTFRPEEIEEDLEPLRQGRHFAGESTEGGGVFSRIPTPLLVIVSVIGIAAASWVLFLQDVLDSKSKPTDVPGLQPGVSDSSGEATVGSTLVPDDELIAAATQAIVDWQEFGRTGDLNVVRRSFLESGRQFRRFTSEVPKLQKKPSDFTLVLSNPKVFVSGPEQETIQADVAITVSGQVQQVRWEFIMRKNSSGTWVVESVRPVRS